MASEGGGAEHWLGEDAVALAHASARRESDREVSDLVPAEWVAITLTHRLLAAHGREITLSVSDGVKVQGVVHDVGAGWVVLRGAATETVVSTQAVTSVRGLGPPTAASSPPRLPAPGVVWREWARTRRPARWSLRDGEMLSGTIWRVGADILDLLVHPLDRPAGTADSRVVVPFSAIRWAAAAH